MQKHLGWTNVATWNVNLYLHNDYDLYRQLRSATIASNFRLQAENVKALAYEHIGDITPDGHNLYLVNWEEIADSFNED
jgi:hypothetical protein